MQGNTPYPSNRAKHKTMKAHRKSRAGCYTCKGRRIKCCESRPVCGHCLRGNMNCVWPEAQPVAVSVRPGGVLYQSRGFGLKDMRFFHDFMTASYPHLPLDCDRAWTNDIPLLAQEHEFLMHAILALGAAHLHRRTNLEHLRAVEQHRAMALRGLIDVGESTQGKKDAISESLLNAQLATVYALSFTASHMRDTICTFLIFVRGLASLTGQLTSLGYSSPFFIKDGRSVSPVEHNQIIQRRLQDDPRKFAYPAEEVEQARRSLEFTVRQCSLAPTELEILLALQNVLDKIDAPFEAYCGHSGMWNIFAMMSGEDFSRFTDSSHINSVVLQAHFLAIDELVWPISAFELPKGKLGHDLHGVKSICVLPSYIGAEDRDLVARLIEWPISFLKRVP